MLGITTGSREVLGRKGLWQEMMIMTMTTTTTTTATIIKNNTGL
jgi:hypothetical protein